MGIKASEFDGLNLKASDFDKLNVSATEFDHMTYPEMLDLLRDKLDQFRALPDDYQINQTINITINKYIGSHTIDTEPKEKWTKVLLQKLFEAALPALIIQTAENFDQIKQLIILLAVLLKEI